MLRFLLLAVLISLSMSLAAPTWAAPAPVTNNDVVTLVRSGLAEDTIRLTVDSAAQTNFDTSPAALAALSAARVPDSVIQAMIRRSSGGGPQTAAAPPAPRVGGTLQTKRVRILRPPITPVTGDTYFTRFNFWHERGVHVTTNYSRGILVPINTRVKFVSLGRRDLVVELPSGERVKFDWVADYSLRPLVEIASELLGPEPVPIEELGDELALSIRTGELRLGMTKEQVLLTRGYPPRHRTPTLEGNVWIYWTNRFVTHTLVFDGDVLIEGRGLR